MLHLMKKKPTKWEFNYPVASAYEAKHDSKWGYVRMPAVTNIVVQKPKLAACQKKTNCYQIGYPLLECPPCLKVSLINNCALALRSPSKY